MTQHKNKFAAREIHFLKSKSEKQSSCIPEPKTFLSDMLLAETSEMKSFKQRIEKAPAASRKFMCAVFKTSGNNKQPGDNEDRLFEETFYIVLDKKRGIWEKIDKNIYALAFWDYQDKARAEKILASLKNKISRALDAKICAGAAWYPFTDFSKKEAVDNAVKAVDHAAFFGEDSLVFADAVTFNISGDRRFNIGLVEQASLEYQRGLELESTNTNLINSLGVCYGIMNMLEKAKEAFEKVISHTANEVIAIYNLGLVHNLENDIDKSISCLKKADSINNRIYEVELLLGTLLFRKGEGKKAMFHLTNAADLNPDSSTPLKTMGEILLEQNEVEAAVEKFKKAIKLNPSDAVSMSGLARAYEIQNKNMDIALTFARKSVSYDPDNPLYRTRLAKIYLKREEHALAKAEFEKASAAKTDPDREEPLTKAAK